VVLVLYAWNAPPTGSAVIKIVAFHLQSLYILMVGGMRWNKFVTMLIKSSSSVSTFSVVAIECLVPGYYFIFGIIIIIFVNWHYAEESEIEKPNY
jgi:hypothetical protein